MRNLRKLNSLQVLRGVAACLVLLYHVTKHFNYHNLDFLGNIFLFGYCGVDMFFVLSGFVILYTSRAFLNGSQPPMEFIKKRFIRIYPSYWLFLLLPITLLALLLPHLIPANFLNPLPYIELFLLTFDHPVVSQITWTLSFELYFYLLFFLFLISRNFKYVIFGILLFSFINMIDENLFNIYLLDNYFFNYLNVEFAFGILACYLFSINFLQKQTGWLFLAGTALVLCGASIEVPFHDDLQSFRPFLYGFGFFMIILSSATFESSRPIKFPKIFIWLGDASYVLYLIHSPLLSFIDNRLILNDRIPYVNKEVLAVLAGLMVIAVSIGVHLWVEKPMLGFLSKRFLRKAANN